MTDEGKAPKAAKAKKPAKAKEPARKTVETCKLVTLLILPFK
jgi:hypothetical protein